MIKVPRSTFWKKSMYHGILVDFYHDANIPFLVKCFYLAKMEHECDSCRSMVLDYRPEVDVDNWGHIRYHLEELEKLKKKTKTELFNQVMFEIRVNPKHLSNINKTFKMRNKREAKQLEKLTQANSVMSLQIIDDFKHKYTPTEVSLIYENEKLQSQVQDLNKIIGNKSKTEVFKEGVVCYHCHKHGHYAPECPFKL